MSTPDEATSDLDTVRRQLDVELPENRRQNDLPYAFYGTSEEGRRFLKEHRLLGAEATLRGIYDRVEKTAEIERYESAPGHDR
jgi:hypothetical protein